MDAGSGFLFSKPILCSSLWRDEFGADVVAHFAHVAHVALPLRMWRDRPWSNRASLWPSQESPASWGAKLAKCGVRMLEGHPIWKRKLVKTYCSADETWRKSCAWSGTRTVFAHLHTGLSTTARNGWPIVHHFTALWYSDLQSKGPPLSARARCSIIAAQSWAPGGCTLKEARARREWKPRLDPVAFCSHGFSLCILKPFETYWHILTLVWNLPLASKIFSTPSHVHFWE
jgi:hypothetical protein